MRSPDEPVGDRLNAFRQFYRPKGGFGVRNGPIRGPKGPVSGSKLPKWSALSLFGKTFSSGDPSVHRLNAFSQFCRPKGGFGVRNGPIRGPKGPVSGSKLTKWRALSLFGKTFSSGDPSVHRLNAFSQFCRPKGGFGVRNGPIRGPKGPVSGSKLTKWSALSLFGKTFSSGDPSVHRLNAFSQFCRPKGGFGVRNGPIRGPKGPVSGSKLTKWSALSLFGKTFSSRDPSVHRLNAFSQFCRPKGGFGVRNGPIRGPKGPVSGSKLTKWSALSLFEKTFSSRDPSVHRLNAFSQFCRPKGGFGVRNGPIRGPKGPVSGSKLTKWSALSLFEKTFSSRDPSVHRLNAFSQFCRPKGGFGVRNGPIRGPKGPVSGSKLTKWSALSLFEKTFSSRDPSVPDEPAGTD
jgi:hypothetical protein